MNLLYDPWVPVRSGEGHRQVRMRDVLCSPEPLSLFALRDDMQMAALQLLVCLAQVVFPPRDRSQVRQRVETPMTGEEYDLGAMSFAETFVLDHPRHPFMQARGVRAEEPTPIQKLFPGLPEGVSHTFFNRQGELAGVCPACAAVALFNQASNCPSFGGGFKGSLRGNAPVTTLVRDDDLRRQVWKNVLAPEFLFPSLREPSACQIPTWVQPLQPEQKTEILAIGLLRGLFWQPAHVELLPPEASGDCDACGAQGALYTAFRKEKFKYELVGQGWPHPHGARSWRTRGGQVQANFVSFTTQAPAWTLLCEFTVKGGAAQAGHEPAPVVEQFRRLWPGEPLTLSVGGYRVKQAAILERRHELVGLAPGWESHVSQLERIVRDGLEVKTALRGRVFGFGKATGVAGLADQAERMFYQRSETLIRDSLRHVDWDREVEVRQERLKDLFALARNIARDVAEPYCHGPKGLRARAVMHRNLEKEFSKLH